MKTWLFLSLLFFSFMLSSCGDSSDGQEKQSQEAEVKDPPSGSETDDPDAKSPPLDAMGIESFVGEIPAYKNGENFKEYTYADPEAPMVFDLGIDLAAYNLRELNYLRSYVYAVKGEMLMDAADRRNFENEDWYQPNYWEESFKPDFSTEEEDFLERVENAMKMKIEAIFTYENGNWVNEGNIVNLGQFANNEWDAVKKKVLSNGMAIKPAQHEQLWFAYDENSYSYTPSFVTSDLFLQVFHMYFSYLIRDLEEDNFIPTLKKLSKGMHTANTSRIPFADTEEEKNAREFNQFYYGLAYDLLTGTRLSIPENYKEEYDATLTKIKEAEGQGSDFLQAKYFDYSLFKPRGHYTRTEDLKKYFRAMMWLQTAPLKANNTLAFNGAIVSALDLDSKTKDGKTLYELYEIIYEPIIFIVGQPNKLSVLDIRSILNEPDFSGDINIFQDAEAQAKLELELKKRDPAGFKMITANQATEEEANSLAVFFFPQRYTFDAEILSRLVDIKRKDLNEAPKRPVPKGLDVFAGLSNGLAEDILLNYYKENEGWPDYEDSLARVKADFKDFSDWDKNVYNKWMQSLDLLSSKDARRQPPFKTTAWEKKCLNTSLASWAELKHDVILYADQPTAAQMGAGGPDWPEPYVCGYVEPNLEFWQATVELVNRTKAVLEKYNMNTGTVKAKTEGIESLATKLRDIVKKELNGEDLNREDQDFIQFIGGRVESLTMRIMEPQVDYWYLIEGPDKFVAVVADVYSYQGANKKVALEEATGYANDIYVTVEQNGRLYLCRGTVLSYYEFEQPIDKRLTDEEWQEKVKNKDIPPVPGWVEEIMVGM